MLRASAGWERRTNMTDLESIEVENRVARAYDQGARKGWEEAAAYLRKSAASLFVQDKDEMATTLKCYSKEMLAQCPHAPIADIRDRAG